MSESCSVCGKKFSGFMSAKIVCDSTKRDFAAYGKDVSGICEKCCSSLKDNLLKEVEAQKNELAKQVEETKNALLREVSVSTTPHDHKWDDKIKGIVTGYSVIGTGPLTEITSAWTDFLGIESGSYLKKIRLGEESAISMAKFQTVQMGANFISGANISIAEATKGNGMIMVSFVGTAVQIGEPITRLEGFKKIVEQQQKLENLPTIVVAETEQIYKVATASAGQRSS